MNHVKTYEAKDEEQMKKDQERVDLLRDLLNENPNNETHDFYVFLASESFEEAKEGLYKKKLEIENMVRISPDYNSVGAMAGMEMRARFQSDSKLYHIWLPKEAREDIEGKGSGSMEPWLVDLIDENKLKGGGDENSRNVYNNVVQRRKDMGKFNI